jgi:hypothetical protein
MMRMPKISAIGFAACAASCVIHHAGAALAQPVAPSDVVATAPEGTRVQQVATRQGFAFHPSTPPYNAFRLAIGGHYDAVDSQVMYGMSLRIPQFTADLRYGLGDGWSLKAHLNTILVINELLLGGSYAWQMGRWSLEAAASVGVYVGKLGQFAFDAFMIAAQYRPELTLGFDLGNDIAISLRGSLLLMGPERVRVGEVWGGFDNSNPFVGHSEMVYVENTLASDAVWYFGLGAMTTRSYYALWLLFPDTPGLYTYPRVVAGYEF